MEQGSTLLRDVAHGSDCAEGINLDLARGTKTGANLLQSGVGVTGMRHQFPTAIGQSGNQPLDQRAIKRAGRQHADGPIGGGESGIGDGTVKVLAKQLEQAELQAARRGDARRETTAPEWFKRIANAAQTGAASRTQQGSQDGRKLMQVLVRVEVREGESSLLQARDLGKSFSFEKGFAVSTRNARSEDRTQKLAGSGGQVTVVLNPRKCALRLWIETGASIDKYHVAADTKHGSLLRELDGVFGGRRGGHQRGAAQAARAGKFNNGAVDAGCKSEVVRVDDELFHAVECIRHARTERTQAAAKSM